MPGQDVLDYRQAETGTARFARTAPVNAVKTFGQARQMLRINADAIVANAEPTAPILAGFPCDLYAPAFRGIAHGIAGEVSEAL